MNLTARYFDGKTATHEDVAVFVTSESLMIQSLSGKKMLATWDMDNIRVIAKAMATAPGILGYKETEEQLVIKDILDWKTVLSRLPRSAKKSNIIPFTTASIMVMALLCAGVIFSMYQAYPALTKLVSRNIPVAWENRLGDYVLESQFSNICASSGDEEYSELLDKLKASLSPSHPITIYVDNVESINALALPGNRIVILKGLITKAKTQEELIGVLAHELGHIEHNHAMNSLVNNLGILLVISTMFNDANTELAEIISTYKMLSYSRENEYQADEFAVKSLIDANIDPSGLASFFSIIEEIEGDIPKLLEIVSTHPATKERISNINSLIKEYGKDVSYKPPLSNKEWKQLKSICDKE